MNYASAFLVLILVAAASYWYISGRRFYTGPIIEAQAGDAFESDRVSGAIDRKDEEQIKV
jgi:hypothetical protein